MAAALRETEEQARQRFQIELEFVQCLGNPNYLNFLAQHNYLKESKFINYIKYLQYWKQPEYAKFLKYPQCLHILDLLQYPDFQRELGNAQCAKFIDDQQLLQWQHYHRKRLKLINAQAEQIMGAATYPGGVSNPGSHAAGPGTPTTAMNIGSQSNVPSQMPPGAMHK